MRVVAVSVLVVSSLCGTAFPAPQGNLLAAAISKFSHAMSPFTTPVSWVKHTVAWVGTALVLSCTATSCSMTTHKVDSRRVEASVAKTRAGGLENKVFLLVAAGDIYYEGRVLADHGDMLEVELLHEGKSLPETVWGYLHPRVDYAFGVYYSPKAGARVEFHHGYVVSTYELFYMFERIGVVYEVDVHSVSFYRDATPLPRQNPYTMLIDESLPEEAGGLVWEGSDGKASAF